MTITEMLVAGADTLAWEFGLRGVDAVHLASTLPWKDSMDDDVMMATFGQDLWSTAGRCHLVPFPADLVRRSGRP